MKGIDICVTMRNWLNQEIEDTRKAYTVVRREEVDDIAKQHKIGGRLLGLLDAKIKLSTLLRDEK